jgi:ABC-type bacteriocin/lantibiotic exporter with double-glycine peptidase domain
MEVRNLYYRHNKNAPLFFDGLSFTLEPRKIHALHGKNGTGKSLLLGLLANKRASHSVFGGEVNANSVTIVNQRYDQLIADQFSFRENLQFASMSKFPKLFKGFTANYCDFDFTQKFNINVDIPVKELSGGQRQILALLMALQKPTKILLLDEPTATLDEENACLVFDFIQSLPDITCLIVCHDKELINRYISGQQLNLVIDENGSRKLS